MTGPGRLLRARQALASVLALFLLASPASANEAGALLGSWCDETGYQLNLTPERISFRDLQRGEDPPPGEELAFAHEMAVYTQDFRPTLYPELGLIACTLTLTGPDSALEACTGPGINFRPRIELKRCPEVPIS